MIPPQLWRRVEQHALLTIRHILLVLAGKHTLHSDTVIRPGGLVNDLGDVPVPGTGFEGAHSELGGIVRGLDDVGGEAVGLGGEVDGLGVGDGVAVEVDTEHDLDDVAILELDLGVGGEGRDVGDDIVDRDGGGEGGACRGVRGGLKKKRLMDSPLPTLTPFLGLFHRGATASATSLSPLFRRQRGFVWRQKGHTRYRGRGPFCRG